MGQIFSYPIHTEEHLLTKGIVSVGQTRGFRTYQEDTFGINEYKNIVIKNGEEYELINNIKILSVFDGHGGYLTSSYLKSNLNKRLIRNLNCKNNKTNRQYKTNHNLIIQKIKNTFWEIDIELYKYLGKDMSGSTAIVCLIINDLDLYSINLGDSRLLLGKDDGILKILSFDHKPNHLGELIRINENGGFIVNNRIQGILALSRSFGDFEFKIGKNLYETAVIVEPEIIIHELESKDKFLLLGSDGLFEIFNNSQIIKYIDKNLANKVNGKDIVKRMINETMNNANNETGCGFDNMTGILYVL